MNETCMKNEIHFWTKLRQQILNVRHSRYFTDTMHILSSTYILAA
jgi:hypothetical protein